MLDGQTLAERFPTELLGRPELHEPLAEAAAWLAGRRILITGAGGSVGRVLSAVVAAAGPACLALVDHHEASLWDLFRCFQERGHACELFLADVRNRSRLSLAFERFRPEIIFHLAAYKHVPFGELFAGEAFTVNVLGTQAVLDLAVEGGVERFVYPSSDKACDPPSLYGATKRLSEALVYRAAQLTARPFNVARFVNILGTRGSVIETFAQQVQTDQPLTVTDPTMTRYWIGMNEAVWLLLRTAALPEGGQTLMVDAREEISVVEMARRVCRLLRGDPDACAIRFGRPRAGERLREVLLATSERFEPGPHPGLLRVVNSRMAEHQARLEDVLERLAALARRGDDAALRAAAMQAAHELQ